MPPTPRKPEPYAPAPMADAPYEPMLDTVRLERGTCVPPSAYPSAPESRAVRAYREDGKLTDVPGPEGSPNPRSTFPTALTGPPGCPWLWELPLIPGSSPENCRAPRFRLSPAELPAGWLLCSSLLADRPASPIAPIVSALTISARGSERDPTLDDFSKTALPAFRPVDAPRPTIPLWPTPPSFLESSCASEPRKSPSNSAKYSASSASFLAVIAASASPFTGGCDAPVGLLLLDLYGGFIGRKIAVHAKPRVLKRLRSRRSRVGVILQQIADEDDGFARRVLHNVLQGRRHELRKAKVRLRREFQPVRPRANRRRTQDGADLVDLVRLGCPWKEGPQREELRKNAAAGPLIDWRVILCGMEQDFWRPVPSRRDVVCVGRPRPNLASQSKVCNFDGVALDQHVLRLDVSVKEAVLVHEGEALQDLAHDVLDLRFREMPVSFLDELV
eukprot:scaffold870_cov268-Pinguiococcus_pyrenoidosus.AAC.65